MLTVFLATLGVVTYLNIGYWWGQASWKVWQKKQRSFAGLLCFPISYWEDLIGSTETDCEDSAQAWVACFSTVESYSSKMAFAWPLKALWSIICLSLLTVPALSTGVFRLVVTMPKSLFLKRKLK